MNNRPYIWCFHLFKRAFFDAEHGSPEAVENLSNGNKKEVWQGRQGEKAARQARAAV
ncbi:hypothetical protein J2X14_001936 [Pantoea alhagi]|nr:hypothetical protein [Pantoea alhagi]